MIKNEEKLISNKGYTNKGITLVALIVTIIIMLILVSVTVTVAINGGLFEKARRCKNRNRKIRNK